MELKSQVDLAFLALSDLKGAHTNDLLAIISLNRPDVANAFNPQMIRAIRDAVLKVQDNPLARVLLIQSYGKHFSAGADLQWMKESSQLSHPENIEEATELQSMFEALANTKIPTLAVVRGAAYGGAVGILACCDIVIATEMARFCLSEVRVGLLPAVILPYLARKIKPGQLNRYALSGRLFNAKEALHCDLVQITCSTDTLADVLSDEINALLLSSPQAQLRYKELNKILRAKMFEQGVETVNAIADARVSPSGQAGLKAFFEKTTPQWAARLKSTEGLVLET